MHFFGIYTNYPPRRFSLLQPASGDTVSLPALLDWEDSYDPDPEDTLLYRLAISFSVTLSPAALSASRAMAVSPFVPPPRALAESSTMAITFAVSVLIAFAVMFAHHLAQPGGHVPPHGLRGRDE